MTHHKLRWNKYLHSLLPTPHRKPLVTSKARNTRQFTSWADLWKAGLQKGKEDFDFWHRMTDSALIYQEQCVENNVVQKRKLCRDSQEGSPELVCNKVQASKHPCPPHLISTISNCTLPSIFWDKVCKYPANLHERKIPSEFLPETGDECLLAFAQRGDSRSRSFLSRWVSSSAKASSTPGLSNSTQLTLAVLPLMLPGGDEGKGGKLIYVLETLRLSTTSGPSTVLCAGDLEVDKTNRISVKRELAIWREGETMSKQIKTVTLQTLGFSP